MSIISGDKASVFEYPSKSVSLADLNGHFHIHMICHKGSGSFVCDQTEHHFSKNDLVILQGDSGCCDLTFSDDFSCTVLAVPRGFLSKANKGMVWETSGFMHSKAHPVTHLDGSEKKLILSDIREIGRRVGMTGDYGRQTVYHSFQILMYDIWDIYDRRLLDNMMSGSDEAAFIFLRFQDLLKKHCERERSVAWYADRLNITPRKLSKVCLDASGSSAGEWITHYTTIRLKELLEHSGTSLENICDQMNFSSRSYFTRYATKVLGVPPSRYRLTVADKRPD